MINMHSIEMLTQSCNYIVNANKTLSTFIILEYMYIELLSHFVVPWTVT